MRDLKLMEGGKFEKGDPVLVNGKPGTVVCASFATHVFRGEVSVLMASGALVLAEQDEVERAKKVP